MKRLLAAVAVLVLVSACSQGTEQEADDGVLWLCQPSDTADPCDTDLSSTAVGRDGRLTPEPAVAPQQPVDCFYVFPTVSQAQSTNAPLEVTEAERQTARAQVARFSSACRVWAPVYRQITTRGLFSGKYEDATARATAHADVVRAWKAFLLANPDRRFVLIGHSQGTRELLQLMQEEVDGDEALRERLVSALLVGGMVDVPKGEVVGGDLKNVPLCTKPGQDGCVVAYNAFAGPPAPVSRFGRNRGGMVAACTNPAALGGKGLLKPYVPAGPHARPETEIGGSGRVTTPYASFPGWLTAECRQTAASTWLQVTPTPGDGRGGELPTLGPAWGLHVVDVNVALGNLVDLVRSQSS